MATTKKTTKKKTSSRKRKTTSVAKTQSSPPAKTRKKTGRPRVDMPLDQVESLAALQCEDREIAAFFGCSAQTVKMRKKSDEAFCTAIEKGRERGKISIRRWQMRAAEAGNSALLIWLGKIHLGQTERRDEEAPVVVNVNIEDAFAKLCRGLFEGTLRQPAAIPVTAKQVINGRG